MNSFRESIRKYCYLCGDILFMTLVLLSVLQINVPLLLVNSGDDPLVHNSLLTIPRTLAGIATIRVSCDLKRNLKGMGSVLYKMINLIHPQLHFYIFQRKCDCCLTVVYEYMKKSQKIDCLIK